jgi:signal transduction histidine kinase/CheY-like chemotaxis protein/AraC-like DNA-binding protein
MRSHLLHIFLGIVCCFGSSYAQNEPTLRVKQLDYNDGLVGRRATAAFQDSDGFMWIATVDALNRYDGVRFQHFNQSNSELNYRDIEIIYEDAEGYLWLRYLEDIEFIHHRTLEVLTFEERFPNVGFSGDEVRDLVGNEQGILLIQLKNTELYLYHNGTFQPIEDLEYTPSLTSAILHGDGISLSNDGIQVCQNNQFKQYDFYGKLQYVKEVEGRLMLNQHEETAPAFTYDEITKTYRLLSCGAADCEVIGKFANTPLDDKLKELRIVYDVSHQYALLYHSSEFNEPMYAIDLKTQQLYEVPLQGIKSFLCKDDNDIIWVLNNDGVALLNFERTPFDFYEGAKNARGIWADTEKLIVATSTHEGYIYDFNTSKRQLFKKLIHTISNNQRELWAGDGGYFYHYNPQTLEILETIPTEKPFFGRLWSSLQDSNGNWWFGHEWSNTKKYILFYNPTEDDSIGLFRQFNEFEALEEAFVMQFLEDGNLVWAASNKGLIAIDKQKGVVATYHKAAKKGFQLPFQEAYWLYKDAENVYWTATNHDGLVRFTLDENLRVSNVKQYSTDYHLSSDVIYSIFEDVYERLWLSTLNGITLFNKKTETVRIFTDQQGELAINEFNRTSGFQAENQRIYFGGVKGAVGFYPSDIDTASYDKKLMLSVADFYIGNNEERTDQRLAIFKNNKIVIEPSVRFAKIEVALADYFDAKDARYFYKIEGLHDDFRAMEGNGIQLSNLPYGKYRLRFRGQAPDKRFSTSEINLQLVVVRPFYLRWWFVVLVIAAVIGLFWLFYNWRVAQLKKRQIELEEIVAQRTEKIQQDKILIEQQAEELKALDKLKDRFFANISHELRTPLTLILGPLGSLLKNSDNLTNKQSTYLNVIKRHTEYLQKRINEIMELNRLEVNKGQIDLQPVKLYDFLKVAVGNFESIAPQKDILFTFDYQMKKTAQILMDKDKFEHIIYNYLSNAFKYTSKGGKVKVTVREVENKLRLEIKDTGVGIPKADIPNLFDRFYQAENAQKAGSSGIGLALCREIAELLGGQVWAESVVGEGSSFYFEMPMEEVIGIVEQSVVNSEQLAVSSQQLAIDSPQLVNQENRPTILLVEDNPELRAYIQSILSEYYHVETAENGKVALERLTVDDRWLTESNESDRQSSSEATVNRQPSLIISDIMMPVMDGLELLKTIKRSDKHRHIPMVMLTARQSMGTKLSALQLGVDDYITKPFDEEELLIRIRNLLKNQAERLAFLKEDSGKKQTSDVLEKSDISTPQISESDQKWLRELETIVNTHLTDSQFTVVICADMLFLSKRQFQRRIKQCTGLNFSSYVRLARLHKARKILENGEMTTMAEVSYAVGFETPAYFSKVFYKEFGKKAVEYLQ